MKRTTIFLLAIAIGVGIAIAAAVARGGTERNGGAAPGRAALSRADDTARVATALGLNASQTGALAKAQTLGRAVTACLLAQGATQGTDGGLNDASGAATSACAAQIQANESFLDSVAFAQVLQAAQPRFEAAASCFARVSGLPKGTIIHTGARLPDGVQERIAQAQAQCFRADGLPR
jgi:hypothetical protein